MPKTYLGLGFVDLNGDDRSYELDIGVTRQLVGGGYLPRGLEGMTEGQADTIAIAAGAHLLKLGGNVIEEFSNPCPADANFTPRKLRFILSNGGSISIPFGDVSTVVSTAQQIKGILEGINSDIRVLCIELLGEEIPNLNVELGVNFQEGQRAQPAGNGAFFSGKIIYQSHLGAITSYPVKVASALSIVPPIFGDIWSSCVTDFIDLPSCGRGGRSNPVKHRRYIAQYAIEPDPARANQLGFEQRELPVNSVDSAQILNCGTLLATQTSIFCISYQGETNRNVGQAVNNAP